MPGSVENVIVYIKNEGNGTAALSMKTVNWIPSSAYTYLNLSWDYTGQPIGIGEVTKATLALSISNQVNGITNFSFAIIIEAQTYVAKISQKGPTASFAYSAPYPYRTVTFNASTSLPGWNGTNDTPVVNYKWDFGDGAKNATTNPIITHEYTVNGTYTVTLNVTDSQGLWNATSETITLDPDIAIVSVLPYAYGVYPTYENPLQINVTAKNEGVTLEGFNVSIYWNATNLIGKQSIVNLAPGDSETLTFNWDFPSLHGYPNNPLEAYPYPTYVMSANASKVLNETDTKNNTLTDGSVTVKWPGDCLGDGIINSLDLSVLAHSWYVKRGAPNYNPQADFNNDGIVNSLDLSILAHNWYKGPLQ
jgi:PKD repeat protein